MMLPLRRRDVPSPLQQASHKKAVFFELLAPSGLSERVPPEPRMRTPEPPRMRTPEPSTAPVLPSFDEELARETPRPPPPASQLPQLSRGLTRSSRMPFFPTAASDATPRPLSIVSQHTGPVEPLSIKKKASTGPGSVSSSLSSSPVRRSQESPTRSSSRDDLPRVLSPLPFTNGFNKGKARSRDGSPDADRLQRLAESTREDVRCLVLAELGVSNICCRSILLAE